MATTQSSTQSDSQTQKSKMWQNELGEARTDATEVRTDPFLIHHTKHMVIQNAEKTEEKKKKTRRKSETLSLSGVRPSHPHPSCEKLNFHTS